MSRLSMHDASPSPRTVRLCRFVLLLSWTICAAATVVDLAGAPYTALCGLIILPLGLVLLVQGLVTRGTLVIVLGATHSGICLLFLGLVKMLHWHPDDAQRPFFWMGLAYCAATAYPTLLARKRLPLYAPWQCQQCGYPLFGLSEPRCPECGQTFDPATMANLSSPETEVDTRHTGD